MTLPCQWGQKATWSHKWKWQILRELPCISFQHSSPSDKICFISSKGTTDICYHSRRYSTKKSAGHFQSFDQLLKCISILGKYHLQVSHFYLIYGKALHFELLLLTWSSCCWPQRNISPNFQGFFWKFGG